MGANIRLFLGLALFVVCIIFPRLAGAAGCPAKADSFRSDGRTWSCSLKSEGANACTYYNDTAHCTRGGGGIDVESEDDPVN